MAIQKNLQTLPYSASCFVCGKENQAGLQSRFFVEDDQVKMPLRAREQHSGYPGVVHGGVIAAALDETMGWAASRAIQRMCMTGELTVRYLQPAPVEKELVVCAEVIQAHRRLVRTSAWLQDEDEVIYARAEARFLPLSVEQTLEVDDGLVYEGGEERVFEGLRQNS